jgi:hypothetical protein
MMIPLGTTLSKWAQSLIIDFPLDNIPILQDEKNWKPWGNTVIQGNSFLKNAAPSPKTYKNPNDWAMDVFRAMANF